MNTNNLDLIELDSCEMAEINGGSINWGILGAIVDGIYGFFRGVADGFDEN